MPKGVPLNFHFAEKARRASSGRSEAETWLKREQRAAFGGRERRRAQGQIEKGETVRSNEIGAPESRIVAKSRPDAPEQRSQTGIWTRAAPLTAGIYHVASRAQSMN